VSAAAEVRELRGEIRHWRRGRADTSLYEALSDAYIAVFAVVLLGSMTISAVANLRQTTGAACTSTGCLETRALLPWLVALTGVLAVVVAARMFGPLFVPPAVSSWLLPTWADRAALLRPRLLWTSLVAFVVGAAAALGASTLDGFPPSAIVLLTLSAGLAGLAVLCLAVRSQTREDPDAKLLTWALALVVWVGLLVLALGRGRVTAPPSGSLAWQLAVVAAILGAVLLLVRVVRGLGRVRRVHLLAGGSLAPSLSGALAGLDLALAYDVLLARRWLDHVPVRPRRGGPSGARALVWLDLVRITRSPQTIVLLAGSVVVPYVAETADIGAAVLLVASLTGFVSGLGLCSALRVVGRTAGLARMLPFPDPTTRAATLVVPVTSMAAFGLATGPALHGATGAPWGDTWCLALAVGASAASAAVRWITGRPPDYSRPLVSSPMGAVPTNLYGSAVRGFDIVLLTIAPMLIWQSANGALFSLALSGVTLSYLVARK
jgi:hypothetical protein